MSEILNIYTALCGMSITVEQKTPRVYGIAEIPNDIPSANLPLRMLEILPSQTEMTDLEFATIGAAPQVDVMWRLSDLMLWLPEAQGRGIKQVSTALVKYLGLYVDAVRANRDIVPQASIVTLNITPGTYRYPADGDKVYFGVRAVVGVKELIG